MPFHDNGCVGSVDDPDVCSGCHVTGNVKVQGLSGLEYMNNLTARSLCKEEIEEITIAEEVDRIYLNAPDKITVRLASLRSELELRRRMISTKNS